MTIINVKIVLTKTIGLGEQVGFKEFLERYNRYGVAVAKRRGCHTEVSESDGQRLEVFLSW